MQIFISYARTRLGIEKHLAGLLARLDDADFQVFRDAKQWSEGALDQVLERIPEADIVLSIVSDAALVIRRHETGRYFISDVLLPDDDQPDPGRKLDSEAISAIVRDSSAPRVVVIARDEHGTSRCVSWVSGALVEFMRGVTVPSHDEDANASSKFIYEKPRVSLGILYGADAEELYILSGYGFLQVHEIYISMTLAPSDVSGLEAFGSKGFMPGFDVSKGDLLPPKSVFRDCDTPRPGRALGGNVEFALVNDNDREWKLLWFAALLSLVVSDNSSSR